ncbi:MAG: hypothetical protein COS76_01475, partial [Candidatus Portnoybacteria bacterium CG06_land_8_20_14_3_00_39_12]
NGGIASTGAILIAFEPEPEPEPESEPELPPEEEATPSEPIVCDPPLASGEQTFAVTTQDNPRMTQVVINPLDVDKFASQTVSVEIQETAGYPITEVTGQARTNNMSFPFSLSLISGTDIDGTWQGSWYNEDEYCQNYMLIITATSQS